ncbi:DUF4145 domain-containing protein [Vibrio sp. S11_S32]|uniref:DUF4145 domain-containing protein n=1 Tax=Vibrio sp. S11_S32 TaxID=2720225 RepID=UPI0016809986|nr:DUF4145 domain-containing protein [Vibrio sp. S11_S32]MBD1575659.1 DUF4145 domain-containing protein [Vibrio sp. S11_S32]
MNYVEPNITKQSFHCPLCGTYAHMKWDWLSNSRRGRRRYIEAECSHCEQSSLWLTTEEGKNEYGHLIATKGEMLLPDFGLSPLPVADMPESVKTDYMEASRIFSRSPRGSAALLRLGLQKLCKHLGQKGENINEDIRALAANNAIPPMVVKVADTVRIAGNNAVHPGEMSDEDFDHVASKMFELINFIVKKAISEPKELEGLYQMIPEAPRKSAEKRDSKNKL